MTVVAMVMLMEDRGSMLMKQLSMCLDSNVEGRGDPVSRV